MLKIMVYLGISLSTVNEKSRSRYVNLFFFFFGETQYRTTDVGQKVHIYLFYLALLGIYVILVQYNYTRLRKQK